MEDDPILMAGAAGDFDGDSDNDFVMPKRLFEGGNEEALHRRLHESNIQKVVRKDDRLYFIRKDSPPDAKLEDQCKLSF